MECCGNFISFVKAASCWHNYSHRHAESIGSLVISSHTPNSSVSQSSDTEKVVQDTEGNLEVFTKNTETTENGRRNKTNTSCNALNQLQICFTQIGAD